MEFTKNYEIPWLDSDDPGAVALYMKCLAEQIEEKYYSIELSLSEAIDRPTAVWERSTTQPSAKYSSLIGTLYLDNKFWNDQNTGNGKDPIQVDSPYVGYNLPGNKIGTYLVGLYSNITNISATITVEARSVKADPTSDNPFGGVVATISDSINATIFVPDSPALLSGTIVARYDDVVLVPYATDISDLPGDLKLWVTYIGPAEITEIL